MMSGVFMIPLFLLLNSCTQQSNTQVHTASSFYPFIHLLKDSLSLDFNIQQAATGILFKQLSLGQKADIVIISQAEWLDRFNKDFEIFESKLIAKNRLCMISKQDSIISLDVLNSKELGIANPDFVPLGYYSMQVISQVGDSINTTFHFNSASQVKKMADIGEVSSAIIYQSQLTKEYNYYCFPDSIQPDISYFILRMNDKEKTISIFNQLTSSNAIKLISLEDQLYLK